MAGNKTMLSFKDRQRLRELENKHGVLISYVDGEFRARHWKDDRQLADAESLAELEIVLRSLHIYPDDEE